MTIKEYLIKNINEEKYEKIDKYLTSIELKLIKEKINLIKGYYEKIDINLFIYRKNYITDDIIELIFNEKINKELLKKTKENCNRYTLDKRTPIMLDLNLILGESQELLFLLTNLNFYINPKSKHNIRTIKSSYDSDFYCKNNYIEFQSTVNPSVNDIYIKKAKFKGLKKIYKDKNCYILQQKIDKDKITYKIINIKDVKIKKEIERFKYKTEYILESNDWQDIKELKL